MNVTLSTGAAKDVSSRLIRQVLKGTHKKLWYILFIAQPSVLYLVAIKVVACLLACVIAVPPDSSVVFVFVGFLRKPGGRLPL